MGSLGPAPRPVEGEVGARWPTPQELNLDAILAAHVALGHDVAALAADCGLSQRELNKQREHQELDDEGGPAALGHQWAYRLGVLFVSVRRRFGSERLAPLVRLLVHAAGFDVARPVASARTAAAEGQLAAVAAVMRETAEAVAKATRAIESGGGIDGREARELLPEIDDARETLATLRALVEARAVPRRIAPVKAGVRYDEVLSVKRTKSA